MLRRSVVTAALLLAVAGVSADDAEAQRLSIGPLVGIDFDIEELYIGAEANVPLESVEVGENILWIIPYFTWFPLADLDAGDNDIDVTIWSVGADGMIPFDMGGNATPFVRAGLNVTRTSVDSGISEVGGSDTNAALHLAGGSFFGPPDSGKFYAQVGVLIGDGSRVAIQGGYQIPVG